MQDRKVMEKEAIFSILRVTASRSMFNNRYADFKSAIEFVSPYYGRMLDESYDIVDEKTRVDVYLYLFHGHPTALKVFYPMPGENDSQYIKHIEVYELDIDTGSFIQLNPANGDSKPANSSMIPSCLISAKLDSMIHNY